MIIKWLKQKWQVKVDKFVESQKLHIDLKTRLHFVSDSYETYMQNIDTLLGHPKRDNILSTHIAHYNELTRLKKLEQQLNLTFDTNI